MTWRHPAQRATWELAAASLRGFRATLDGLGFTEIQTPKFVESATESGANVFEVDYFGRPAYLAQSPQFYKQQLVGVFERVYEVGPVFRAEPHDTVRHLAEYVSLDVELGFIEDHRDVLAVLREVLAGMVAAIHEYAGPAVERLGARRARWCPRRSRCSTSPRRWRWSARPADEPDLAPEHERALGRVGAGRARQRLPRRRGLPDGEAAVLHPPRSPTTRAGPTASTCSSAASSWSPAGSGCTAPSTYDAAIRARGEDPAAYAAYLAGVPPRHAAARRLRDRAGALGGAAGRGGQHPRGHAVPARPAPAQRPEPEPSAARPSASRSGRRRLACR